MNGIIIPVNGDYTYVYTSPYLSKILFIIFGETTSKIVAMALVKAFVVVVVVVVVRGRRLIFIKLNFRTTKFRYKSIDVTPFRAVLS